MTTKNLSRSVIEGGRTGHYKAECQKRIRQERAAWRAQASAIACDPEAWDEEPDARRGHVSVSQDDKLSPIYRFLDSRVGQSWDAVRSELFQKFDTRTTPGRHVLFDHLLKDVRENPESAKGSYLYTGRYFRDKDGILREDAERFGKNVTFPHGVHARKKNKIELSEVARWLGTSKIGRAGSNFALYVPAGKNGGGIAVVDRGQIVYACIDFDGAPIYDPQPAIKSAYSNHIYPQPPKIRLSHAPYRQDGMLSEEAKRYFHALPTHTQEMVCALAPANF